MSTRLSLGVLDEAGTLSQRLKVRPPAREEDVPRLVLTWLARAEGWHTARQIATGVQLADRVYVKTRVVRLLLRDWMARSDRIESRKWLGATGQERSVYRLRPYEDGVS